MNMKKSFLTLIALAFFLPAISRQPLKVGVAGLSHDHALGLMHQYKNGKVILLGIAEADTALSGRYKRRFQLPDSIFYTSLVAMLQKIRPDAVLAYNPVYQHIDVVEACAPKGISVMVEKPLATTVAQANRMAELARKHHIHLLTNYETTWYPSNQQLYTMVQSKTIGDVRRMVVHDGHEGPKEIGCSNDFLQWLTDPVKNGGGAITDFGCYGANLMTWLMNGQAPVAVTAITHQIKPNIYPKVDDDATIVLDYSNATGVIEASWNWPFSIKDWEVFGNTGYLHALNPNTLHQRLKSSYEPVTLQQPLYTDNLQYLSDVLHGKIKPGNDLSSLENNIIVVRILEAAKRSAKEGRRVPL
ncbi:oxidoreductase [Niastella populi]|uniref:Oxidoreductase n=2 Tax=Niastella populi TaxID=550983 RepID=A0A1V9FL00_9BACT|nr:oxidoreductase [Niastella populi]